MNKNIFNLLTKKFDSGEKSGFRKFAQFVAFGSIFLGSMALILSMSILDGFDKALKEKAISFVSHISVKSYHSNPIINYNISMENLKSKFNQIDKITPIIEREGLVKSKDYIDGIIIRGLKSDGDITGISNYITSGKFNFSNENSNEIVIGQRLAEKLNIKNGDKLILFALNSNDKQSISDPNVQKFEVIGIYESGMAIYDESLVFIPFLSSQKLFNLADNSATSFEIILKDFTLSNQISKEIDDALKFPFYSVSVFEQHASLFSWIELQKEPIPLFLGIISIVAVLNIVTTLLILVVEKTNAIGILKTLGMGNTSLRRLFIWKGLKIGLLGSICGSLVSYLFSVLQKNYGLIKLDGSIYFIDKLPIDININHYMIVFIMTIVLTFFSTIIPAYISTKINPLKSIRFK